MLEPVFTIELIPIARTPRMRMAERIIDYVTRHPVKTSFQGWRSMDKARDYIQHELLMDTHIDRTKRVFLYNIGEAEFIAPVESQRRWWVGKNWLEKRYYLLESIEGSEGTIQAIAAKLGVSRLVCSNWLKQATVDGLVTRVRVRDFPVLYIYKVTDYAI